MTRQIVEPAPRLALRRPLPAALDAGAPFAFELVVESDSGSDPEGAPWHIRDAAGRVLADGRLPALRRLTPDSEDYDPRRGPVDIRPFATITATAPRDPGRHDWFFVLPPFAAGGVAHGGTELPLALATRAHATSLSVWDCPGPVTADAAFTLKVGAKCSAGCDLSGQRIEVLDAGGALRGEGVLGDIPWAGTQALHWAEIALTAPATEGAQRWTARIAPRADLPHAAEARAGIGFVVTRAPEHRVTVTLSNRDTGAPVAGAHLRFGPFQAFSDERGTAAFLLPGGEFGFAVTKTNHEVAPRRVTIDRDLDLRVEVIVHPEKDPLERYWKR